MTQAALKRALHAAHVAMRRKSDIERGNDASFRQKGIGRLVAARTGGSGGSPHHEGPDQLARRRLWWRVGRQRRTVRDAARRRLRRGGSERPAERGSPTSSSRRATPAEWSSTTWISG